MNDSYERMPVMGVLYFIACGFLAGMLYASSSAARERRAREDRAELRNRLFELERAFGLYDPPLDVAKAGPAPKAKK